MNHFEDNKGFSVLIPDGESRFALTVIRCLGQIKNIKIIVLSSEARPLVRFSRHVFKFLVYEDNDTESRLKKIYNTVKELKPDVLLPVDVPTISLVSENLDLLLEFTTIAPVPDIGTLRISNNKWLLSEWLKHNKIPFPPTTLIKTENIHQTDFSNVSFPALIKPPMGSGGDGIEYLESATSLANLNKENQRLKELVLQSFIKGYDIDCSILCKEGKIMAYTIQKGFIGGKAHFQRAEGIDIFYNRETFEIVKDLAEKMNWSGIVHIDLRYDEVNKQVNVIEMNPRFWGSLLGSLCAGINFPYLSCLIALGREIPENKIVPIRYVQGKAAIKIMAQRLIKRKRENSYFDHSVIPFLVKDPIPNLLGSFQKFTKN